MRIGAFAFFAAGLLLAPLSVAVAQPVNPPATGRQHSPLRDVKMMTPEQRMMMAQSLKQQGGAVSKDQRKALRRQEMGKFKAMNVADRQKYVQGLQAKWDALPADQKQKLQQKMAAREAKKKARAQ